MSDLLVEVDEALKQERLEKLWQQYGGVVISVIVAIILGASAHAGYKAWSTAQNEAQTSKIIEALAKDNTSQADILAIQPELNGDLQGLMALNASALALENDDKDAAQNIYAEYKDAPEDSVAVKQLLSLMAIVNGDKTADEKLSALNGIANDANNTWRYHAALEAAVIEAREKQNYDAALKHLDAITSATNTPETLQKKAQSLTLLYSLKADNSEQNVSN